jgi:iron complex transport system substrate-binding protein
MRRIGLPWWVLFWVGAVWADGLLALEVSDDRSRPITLERPAERIISLAPHITELLFAAGAGELIVGTVDYSDYPEAAASIPRIGSHAGIDLERVLALKPDLVVAWHSGNPIRLVERLERLGIPVYVTEPRTLESIAEHIRKLGTLAGSEEMAERVARDFLDQLAELRQRYQERRPVSVYFQISGQPLMTVNGAHLISSVIRLCGGINIFAALSALAPAIALEAVLAADPDVIFASGPAASEWLREWHRWSMLKAVQRGHLYSVPEDWITRQGPRILLAAHQVCRELDKVRASMPPG